MNNAVAEPDPVNPDHILDDKSIAIQKSVVVVGGGIPAPGKQLEYTLTFQVSDYYTFGDLVITDTIGDGQNFLASPGVPVSTPTFTVSDRSGTTAGTFSITFPAVPADTLTYTANVDGTETMVFDVSKAMVAFGDDGILVGGLATAADDLGIPPANAGLQAPALGTVTFRVVIPDQYTTLPPSGSPPIAQGDSLTNAARIDGTVRDNAAPGTVIGSEDDDTSTGTGIPVGSVSKSIYAVNGVVPPPPGFVLAPGDRLTYSLGYTLPISSFVNFSLTDSCPCRCSTCWIRWATEFRRHGASMWNPRVPPARRLPLPASSNWAPTTRCTITRSPSCRSPVIRLPRPSPPAGQRIR